MAQKDWAPSSIFELLGDDLARRILIYARQRPVSAEELGENLNASLPTIYRRVNALVDYDLLTEEMQIDDDGNHYKRFETALEEVTLTVEESGYSVDIQIREELGDQFADFWSELGSTDADPTLIEDTHRESSGDEPHYG